MDDKDFRMSGFLEDLRGLLCGYDRSEVFRFLDTTRWFGKEYCRGCELEGPVYLVLDNSVIQAFKHKDSKPKRGIDALAYTTFCRFAGCLSERTTRLALTPAAIFEHMGCKSASSAASAHTAMLELGTILRSTKLPIVGWGFNNAVELYKKLKNVQNDEEFLTEFVKGLDDSSWRTDLRAPIGVRIPLSIAYEAIPDDLPLEYFDQRYVKFVLSGRVEQYIVEQSRHNTDALPISSGEFSKALSKLNSFSKRSSVISGLGDIDLLQTCDLSRQFQHKRGYVLLGQTLDRGLNEVLAGRSTFVVESSVDCGASDRNEQIDNMVSLMFSDPFSENHERGEHIWLSFQKYFDNLIDICADVDSCKGVAE